MSSHKIATMINNIWSPGYLNNYEAQVSGQIANTHHLTPAISECWDHHKCVGTMLDVRQLFPAYSDIWPLIYKLSGQSALSIQTYPIAISLRKEFSGTNELILDANVDITGGRLDAIRLRTFADVQDKTFADVDDWTVQKFYYWGV